MTTEERIFTVIGLDFETGGLDCTRHACTQIALQAIRLDTLETIDRYVTYIAPYNRQETAGQGKRKVLKPKWELQLDFLKEPMGYEPKALAYSGITMEKLSSQGIDLEEAAKQIIAFARRNTLTPSPQCKPVLAGHNAGFDIGFLQQLISYASLTGEFERTFAGTKDFYGNFQPAYIDTIQLARLAFARNGSVTSYKLELVAAKLGIDLDDAHDAGADIAATVDVLKLLSLRIRSEQGSDEAVIKRERTRDYFKI
ncbi:MAG: 3'-5' exonuclease [Dysgonamonadaceae bacterium]|jgi:DNA polymerase III epsilon subunit-like protein|nr:3'-5' exonuclease [Dysgonamonadaceae bacterium]